jgi:phospholipid/cholesterol/gamma-HCH transport system ATP-binding protein
MLKLLEPEFENGHIMASSTSALVRRPVEILVENVSKAFDRREVLRGIDLTVRRGDMVAIVGGSGCGKTVLLNHILGQLTPDSGRILVVDHERPDKPLVDLTTVDVNRLSEIQRHWGVVFQRNALFSGTVLDNIALWLREVRNLEDVDILPIARTCLGAVRLPNLDEFLNSSVEGLSEGMAKRLAIARALAMHPELLFYDEPTTGLDPTSASQIQDLILATHNDHRAGLAARTSLIITHDKDLLRRLKPRVVMLYEGRVSFDGSFDDFERSNSQIIRPYFDLMPVIHATGEMMDA